MKKTLFWISIILLCGCGSNEKNDPDITKIAVDKNIDNQKIVHEISAEKKPLKTNIVQIGPNVFLEIQGEKRTVVVSSKVVRREGFLELLLCREKTKEHESILAASVDARDLHQAMLSAGLKPGNPVQFQPEYKPATGVPLDIKLRYIDPSGNNQIVPAREWVKKSMTNKTLEATWVFAGSRLVPNTIDSKSPPYFLANDGDLISISNFESALIDVSVKISSANSDLGYEPMTEKIPKLGTNVAILIEAKDKKP